MKQIKNSKKLKYGTMSTVLTVLFIVMVFVVNILVGFLGQKVNMDIDLTANQLYDISADTKDYVKSMDQKVEITICTPEDQFNQVTLKILKKYDQMSDNISFRAVDINLDPSFAQNYQGESLSKNSIIVSCGDRYKVLSYTDLYTFSQDSGQVTSVKAEQKLTSAIMYVTSDTVSVAYFTEGHDEYVDSTYQQLCKDNNLQVESLNLATQEISADAEYLIIFGPQRDFTVEELAKLDEFADAGERNILIYLDASTPELPNLFAYMEEWGISPKTGVVLDDTYAYGQVTNVIASYADSEITSGLSGSVMTVMPGARPMELLFETGNSCETFAILNSYDTAYMKGGELTEDTLASREDGDIEGPFLLAAGSTKSYSGVNTLRSTNMLVFGSAVMATNTTLSITSFGNMDVAANALLYKRTAGDQFVITPKYFDDTSLTVTAGQARMLTILFIVLVPLALLVIGIVVWIRRKNR